MDVQYICYLQYRWAAVCPNSFYLVTDITDEENSCYPNSSLPGNLWSTISLEVHHAYLNLSQNTVYDFILQYSNPQGRVWRAIFLFNSIQVYSHRDLSDLFILWQIFCAGDGQILLSFTYFNFLSDIKRVQYRTGNGSCCSWVGMGLADRQRKLESYKVLPSYVHCTVGWINFVFFENFKLPHVACAQGGVKITCSNSEFFKVHRLLAQIS